MKKDLLNYEVRDEEDIFRKIGRARRSGRGGPRPGSPSPGSRAAAARAWRG